MAMIATYTSFSGRVVKENRGAVKRYVADTLGSTHKLTDASGAVIDSFEYWPCGEVVRVRRRRAGGEPPGARAARDEGSWSAAPGAFGSVAVTVR